jgi:hypothetical protein
MTICGDKCYSLLVPYGTPKVPRSLTESRGTYDLLLMNEISPQEVSLPRQTSGTGDSVYMSTFDTLQAFYHCTKWKNHSSTNSAPSSVNDCLGFSLEVPFLFSPSWYHGQASPFSLFRNPWTVYTNTHYHYHSTVTYYINLPTCMTWPHGAVDEEE